MALLLAYPPNSMNTSTPLFLGIDLGTGGVRCLLVDSEGNVHSESRSDLESENVADATHPDRSEQSSIDWVAALDSALQLLEHRERIVAIAVDSTSGTVLPVDRATGEPLSNAILYNDRRAVAEADRCTEVLGQSISPTFGLPKILWLQKNLVHPRDTRYLHAADYLNEQLRGCEVATDFTNAMKSGANLDTLDWPDAIGSELGLPQSTLPRIVRPGEPLGHVSPNIAAQYRIPETAMIYAGATDSNAAFYASGAGGVGEWCHTLGTTLAIKGISDSKLHDPGGRLYNHRHPDGHWLPGGASNCGGEILKQRFAGQDLTALDEAARARSQTEHIVYPLARKGDRLPFAGDQIHGFVLGDEEDSIGCYLGCLEGVALVERLTIEMLEELGAPVGECIFATGGGARSDLWLQIRAEVTQRTMVVPACPESAFGAAILAAAGFLNQSVGETSRQMVRLEKRVTPTGDPAGIAYYEKKYTQLRKECDQRFNLS